VRCTCNVVMSKLYGCKSRPRYTMCPCCVIYISNLILFLQIFIHSITISTLTTSSAYSGTAGTLHLAVAIPTQHKLCRRHNQSRKPPCRKSLCPDPIHSSDASQPGAESPVSTTASIIAYPQVQSTAKQTITLFTRSSDCRIFCTCQTLSIASPLSIALH